MAAVIDLPVSRPGATQDDWAHFDLVLGLTADLLPVVSNPRAVISPDSTLKDLGKTPSRYNGARQAVGFGKWTEHTSTPAEIAGWSRERDLGICLQTRRVRALDVDVTDVQLAGQIAAFLAPYGLPVRSRANAAKFLVAFELPGEFFKRRVKCASGMVEFLATGQQFIAVGTHPSGSRYEWTGGLPDAFPVLSGEQFEALWSQLVATFGVEAPSESGASVKGEKLASAIEADPVARHLLDAGRVKRTERDGRLHITCPFEDEHTGDSGETSTTYWPAHTGGYVNGHFRCLHAHCEHREDQAFRDAIGYVDAGLLSEFSAIAQAAAQAVVDPDAPTPIVDAAPAAAPSPAKNRFVLQQVAAFVDAPPQRWLIKGVLPQAELGLVFGESGAGKSFALIDMLVDLATGRSWRGLRTNKCRVVYVAAEGAGGVRRRMRAIAQQRGLQLSQLDVWVLADTPNLLEKKDAIDLAKAIVANGGADVIAIDTLAQVTPGGNENSGEDMGKAISHCRGVHHATGAMVLLVHHTGKDTSKGARGWSGIKGALDVEMEISRAGEKRSLYVSKMKDGREGMEYQFRLDTVVLGFDGDGEEEASCVVSHIGDAVQRTRDNAPKGTIEKMVLSALEDLGGISNAFVEHGQLKDAVRAQIPHDPAAGRDRRGERVERAIESLISNGYLFIQGTTLCLKQ